MNFFDFSNSACKIYRFFRCVQETVKPVQFSFVLLEETGQPDLTVEFLTVQHIFPVYMNRLLKCVSVAFSYSLHKYSDHGFF